MIWCPLHGLVAVVPFYSGNRFAFKTYLLSWKHTEIPVCHPCPGKQPASARYREEPYEFITYRDLYQAVNGVDREHYSLVLLLSGTPLPCLPGSLTKSTMFMTPEYKPSNCIPSLRTGRGFKTVSVRYARKSKTAFSERETRKSDCRPSLPGLIWLLT